MAHGAEGLGPLLMQSQAFHSSLIGVFEQHPMPPSRRAHVAYGLCSVAFAHSHAVFTLIVHKNNSSAFAILRVLYECLLRGNWVLRAASEDWIDAMFESKPSPDSQTLGFPFPSVDEMLVDIGAQPASGVVRDLAALKTPAGWNAMNSYTHGGQYQIGRYLGTYDSSAADALIRNVNALAWMTAKTMVEVLQDPELCVRLLPVHHQFIDCFHPRADARPIPQAASTVGRKPSASAATQH